MWEMHCPLEFGFQRGADLGKRTKSIFNQTFQRDHHEQNYILVKKKKNSGRHYCRKLSLEE